MARKPDRSRSLNVFLWFWLPVLLCMTTIIILSAQPRLKPPIKFPNSDKVYHTIEYGGLGVLLARAVWATLRTPSPMVAAIVSLAGGVGMAVADEAFQSTVPGRESTVTDVVADAIGVVLAQLLYFGVLRRREPAIPRALIDSAHPDREALR